MDAESSYLFRHALLRDAAYQVQIPSDRAPLHALVVLISESLFGGRPPEPAIVPGEDGRLEEHHTDTIAAELAQHAQYALEALTTMQDGGTIAACRRVYLHRSAILMTERHSHERAAVAWAALAPLLGGVNSVECLRRCAMSLHRVGKPRQAESQLQEAARQAQELSSPIHLAAVLASLGIVLLQSGRTTLADEPMRRALALIPPDSHTSLRASILNSLGSQQKAIGDRESAKQSYLEALELRKAIGTEVGVAATLGNMATLLCAQGQYEESESLARQALEVCRRIKHEAQEGSTLPILAWLLEIRGRYEEAAAISRAALLIQRKTGNRRGESSSLSSLGTCLFLKNPAEAETAFNRALEIQIEAEELSMASSTLNNLGNLLAHHGRFDEAVAHVTRGLEYARSENAQSSEGILLGTLGMIDQKRGRPESAVRLLEQALGIHHKAGNRRFIGLHSCDLAAYLVELADLERARTLWAQGIAILLDIGDSSAVAVKRAKIQKACLAAGVASLAG
ncbi:MAG: tetratricopeptide repeat protein [Planctomycetes bacterium]|nr:tetratricopeptide repeat protein [Planctomycetota bacterium]